MENLCLVEKYYSEGKVEKADITMLDFINYLHNSNLQVEMAGL